MPELAFVPHSHTLVYNTYGAAGESLLELVTPEGVPIRSIALPPETGRNPGLQVNPRFLTVETDQDEVIVLDLDSGKEIHRIALAPSRVPFFDPQGDVGYRNISTFLAPTADVLLVSQRYQGVYGDGLARLFDLNQPGQEAFRLETAMPFSNRGDLSPDGAKFALGGLWNGDVRIWSTQNGGQSLLLKGHTDVVNQAIFSPDGAKLATVSADGAARLWEAESGKPLRTLDGHQGWVLCGTFAPDGTGLLTYGSDHTLRLWSVATGEETRRFESPVPGVIITGIWFTAPHTVLIDVSDRYCSGCRSRSFLLDTNSGAVTEQPWQWLAVYPAPDGTWLLRHGAYPDYRLGIGVWADGQFQAEKELSLTSSNNAWKIGLAPGGQWVYTFNVNGINVFDRSSGEQVDLAANYLCFDCVNEGELEVDPNGLFLVTNEHGNAIIWGVPE